MKHSRRIAAFASGLALYSTAVMLGGSLAGLRLPLGLTALWGHSESLPQLLAEATVYALPIFALALSWSYVTLRPYRRGRWPATAWCLGGLGLAWLAWLLYGVVCAAETTSLVAMPLSTLLLSPQVPPLWGLLNGLAVLVGVLVAGVLARRHVLLQGLTRRR
ncbi:hypothetical protein [Paucibacter sp. XJ19-41]|uniref:hypothetical protein n=1 Tax=Paucibacter sp. XJ19-41 TaxID=2927824 RepID=UPI00234964A2|nr:hypothetical protein [Paucibacter sp. XJ19-41]MDC6167132.1 hypothetical protein [Paucibacter sp. XJ19-41]